MLPRFFLRSLALALVASSAASAQRRPSVTSPPSGDTTGYWQQRIRYEITATLDEARMAVRGSGRLIYVNQSPDTLRELYFHQYLNAFRPHSAWSVFDAREGRVRFQNLADPDYGYERFTRAPLVNGRAVTPEYPGAPDSTVVRLLLPQALVPGDSLAVDLDWEARPSTVVRRQGRAGRTYDLAQWYPKVAVYDRGGWQPNAFVAAGELYGEFGDYDVTLVLPGDDVVAATGVSVAGDPGWERVKRWGTVYSPSDVYVAVPPARSVETPAGMRAVRFYARNVHHFAWSASPDYRYEGGVYVRGPSPRAPDVESRRDSVGIHVLYKSGDEGQWGNGQAVKRTLEALAWLERTYGDYAYPQVTNLHRLDGGGTEFPMMMMNGSAGLGLILHEGGHIFTYGILANNEWQSGWMDEGLTSYQTAWAQGQTPQERAAKPLPAPPRAKGYRGYAERPHPADAGSIERYRVDLLGRAEPIGTRADLFNEFAIYNAMIYARAQAMYGALRDVMGDSAFSSFLHLYYRRWALRHVDELAMRRAAEDASGLDLRWFFDQWVHRIGLVDYSLRDVQARIEGGEWITTGRVVKRGEYFHPMRLGVRTQSGWTTQRVTDALGWSQRVTVRTRERPLEVHLDPRQTADDWYGPNDKPHVPGPVQAFAGKTVFDWPFLDQAHANRIVNLVTPIAWYGTPGGLAAGVRLRDNYQGYWNRTQLGLALTARQPAEPPNPAWTGLHVRHVDPFDRLQVWATSDDARIPWKPRPTVGLHLGAWAVDGVFKLDAKKSWDLSPFLYAPAARRSFSIGYSAAYPIVHAMLDPVRWSGLTTSELNVRYAGWRAPAAGRRFDLQAAAGYQSGRPDRDFSRDLYYRAEALVANSSGAGKGQLLWRAFLGGQWQPTIERSIYFTSANPITTFSNHFYRPDGSLLGRPSVHFVPIGGAGLRGISPRERAPEGMLAINLEQNVRVTQMGPTPRPFRIFAALFENGALTTSNNDDERVIGTAGVSLVARGFLYDRDVRLRFDMPLLVSASHLAIGDRTRAQAAFRWSFSLTDLW